MSEYEKNINNVSCTAHFMFLCFFDSIYGFLLRDNGMRMWVCAFNRFYRQWQSWTVRKNNLMQWVTEFDSEMQLSLAIYTLRYLICALTFRLHCITQVNNKRTNVWSKKSSTGSNSCTQIAKTNGHFCKQ